MSGICGIISFDGAPVEPSELDRMVQAALHRGPDGVGYWLRRNVGFANLRLNITPESTRENQPQVAPGGTLVLTASARVDNRDELIRVLTAKGYLKNENLTDADLILAGYQYWGRDCARYFIGDFAFAIWDSERQALFAARDPMGFRAFYYRHEPRRLIFATEVKQILEVPGISAQLFEPAIGAHLAMTNLFQEWTFFEGVFQLPPGHALWCDAAGLRTWRFWDVDSKARTEYVSEVQYYDHFREIFEESVRARLRSKRPVGVWLSGGLDSGSVASTAGWLRQQNGKGEYPPVHAYSWTFDTLQQCDERHISDGIVEHYNFPVNYISAEQFAPLNGSSPIVTHPDEPLVQVYSPLLEQSLLRAREEGVGLILSGFRGDPMAESGDFDYLDLLLAGRWLLAWKHVSMYRRRVPSWPVTRLVRDRFLSPLGEAILWTRTLAWITYPAREAIQGSTNPFPARPYPAWIQPDFAEKIELRRMVQQPRSRVRLRGLARRSRYRSIFWPKFFRAAVEQERHNATAGIGYADPWSDRRLVEFILSVPHYVLSRIGDEKRITRQAMRGIMPEQVRLAAGKIVPTPLYERLIREDARAAIFDLFTGSQLAARGFVSEDRLRNYYQAFLKGGREDPRIWPTITAELWLRRHWN